ncbi:MAG: ribosomal RNA small subunit methyltransferase A [Nanoarchaeota archaeon]|mgnify:CR=1 FL=1|nr:ribosomal RNA small subunit methyltransferase A [Nanoarchaeota archaeon]|tara:strand:- start:9295 stop:10080 length:786 start_codon:yes stop_codon:yes gene_type:complete
MIKANKSKKSLGQNFLTSQSIVDKIVSTADIKSSDIVLEVGPGKGILTEALLGKAGKVVSVEKDDELIPLLKEKFADEIKNGKLILVHSDILTFNFQLYKLSNFKIVANIPYYITGEFLRKMLSSDIQPSQMVLLVQKEVAERIIRSKKESILSISVKAYGEPKYIRTVKAGSFNPTPKVDSAILLIDNISKNFFKNIDEKRFFEVVKTGFAHKRKLLRGNLSTFADKEKLKIIFKQLGIDEKIRAEEISVGEWGKLARML